MVTRRLIAKVISWCLFAIALLLVLTGLGITRYGIVTLLTGGIFSKALSYQLHQLLWGPFLILLFIHMYLFTSGKKI